MCDLNANDLDVLKDALKTLLKAEIVQICLGPHDIQFNFHPRGNVSVWGRCELIDATGQVIDIWERATRPGTFRLPELLMVPVVDVAVDSARSFVLKFQNKITLRVAVTSGQVESFSINNLYL